MNIHKVLVFCLLLVTAYPIFGGDFLLETKIDQMDKSIKKYEKHREREQELELEAMLLVDSFKVIDDCIKNKEFHKLKKVYDKIAADPIYTRPTKDQIDAWRKVVQAHIDQAKIGQKKAKESHSYAKLAIFNGLALATSFGLTVTSLIWGSNVIKNSDPNTSVYLAKYALDAGIMIGFPLSTVLLIKFAWQLIPQSATETLRKTDSLLTLFEQLA